MSSFDNELQEEILLCARYGEDEDLLALLLSNPSLDVNYKDPNNGCTAMHYAAANGELKCLSVLRQFKALHLPNNEGSLPCHWAAQNRKADSLQFMFDEFSDIDVLVRNSSGRSTLTDAFQSGDAKVIEVCLSHPSASEERLIETTDLTSASVKMEVDEDPYRHAIRELPIERADNPFGSDVRPEDDTTGLCIWPASIILARWVVQDFKDRISGGVVVELGAGCGLPAIATAAYCSPRLSVVTDLSPNTLDNAKHNIKLNQLSEDICCCKQVNWQDPATFPVDKADFLLGSDLVYDSKILSILIPAIRDMLSRDGLFLYVAPDSGRDGMAELKLKLSEVGIVCVSQIPANDSYFKNPLQQVDEDWFVLNFYDLSAKQPHSLYVFAFQI